MNPWIGTAFLVAAGVALWLGCGWWSLLIGFAGSVVYIVGHFVVASLRVWVEEDGEE